MSEKNHTKQRDIMLVKTVDEFVRWTKKLEGRLLLYRGLADFEWAVEASGYRRIKSPETPLSSSIFQNYIVRLIDNAKLRGFREKQGRELSALELLADLQHNGVATCFIDCTTNPLVALWFACTEELKKDGQVIAMPTNDASKFSMISHNDLDKEIKELLDHENPNLWKWTPPGHLGNRAVAQHSVFVFGKGVIEPPYYKRIKIDGECKKAIRDELENKFGITEQHLFNDLTGFSLANAHDKPYTDHSADDYFSWGQLFDQISEHEKAVGYYTKAIELDSQNASTYNNRGIAKSNLEDYQDAIKDFTKAIELDPKNAIQYYNRGAAKDESGDYQGAIEDYTKGIELNPKNADLYNKRGIAKGALRDYKGAIEDYDKAIELNPKNADLYNKRGIEKGALRDYKGAIEDYDKAIELAPQNAITYNNRGVAKSNLEDYQDAIKDFNKAIELNPKDAIQYYNRGVAKDESGDYQGAIEDYTKGIELNPKDAALYNNRGIAKGALRDYQDAIKDFNKAIELDPKNAIMYADRGVAKSALGDLAGARHDSAMATELDPSLDFNGS